MSKSKSKPNVIPEAGKCWCGCGGTTKSRFAMGHDAKLKSVLVKALRGDGLSAEQKALVKTLGWQKFMTPAPVKSTK